MIIDDSLKTFRRYTAFAFTFALIIRLLPLIDLHDSPLPIWSPDAGLYGYYAQTLLAGHPLPWSAEYLPGHLIAAIAQLSGAPLDWIMLILPIVLASLIVLPVMLIGLALNNLRLGFFAAMLTAVSANYYTRSHLGYMDTDGLNLFFPYLAIALWMLALLRPSLLAAAGGALALVLFRGWYHSSAAILLALIAAALLYTLIFARKERLGWQLVLLAALSLAPLPPLFAAGAILLLTAAFQFAGDRLDYRPYLVLIILGILSAPFLIDVGSYLDRAQAYMQTLQTLTLTTSSQTLHFTNVLTTVQEAQSAPIYQINPLFEGLIVYVPLALFGFLWLIRQHPVVMLGLPLLLLGMLCHLSGIRFSMFAAPALALGFVALAQLFSTRLNRHLIWVMLPLALTLMLYNITLFNRHIGPFYFEKQEVSALRAYAQEAPGDELLISWWDFGWPLWYYTGRNTTLIDNGLHGADTYLVARMLTATDDATVVGAARFAAAHRAPGHLEALPYALQHRSLEAIVQSLPRFRTDGAKPAAILLHRDMLLTLPAIQSIARRDPLQPTQPIHPAEFYVSRLLAPPTAQHIEADTFTFDPQRGIIQGRDGPRAQVAALVVSTQGKVASERRYSTRSNYFLIIFEGTHALYMERAVFESFLIQALLLDRYDEKLLQKVVDTGRMKLLRLR